MREQVQTEGKRKAQKIRKCNQHENIYKSTNIKGKALGTSYFMYET